MTCEGKKHFKCWLYSKNRGKTLQSNDSSTSDSLNLSYLDVSRAHAEALEGLRSAGSQLNLNRSPSMTEYSQALHVTLWLSVFVSMELLQATDGGNPLHTQTQGSLYWTDYGNGWQFNTHTHNGYLDIQTHTHTCSLLSECGHRWGLCGHRGVLSSEAWRGFRGRQLAVLQAAELSEEATTSPASFFGESACIHGNSPSVTHIHAVQERQDEKQNVPGLKNMWG